MASPKQQAHDGKPLTTCPRQQTHNGKPTTACPRQQAHDSKPTTASPRRQAHDSKPTTASPRQQAHDGNKTSTVPLFIHKRRVRRSNDCRNGTPVRGISRTGVFPHLGHIWVQPSAQHRPHQCHIICTRPQHITMATANTAMAGNTASQSSPREHNSRSIWSDISLVTVH